MDDSDPPGKSKSNLPDARLQSPNRGTEIKINEAVAREEQIALLRYGMNASSEAIFLVKRATGLFAEVNTAACSMLRHTRLELLQTSPLEIGMTVLRERESEHDPIVSKNYADELFEAKLRRKDGSYVRVELRRQMQPLADGWVFVGVARDVAERESITASIKEGQDRINAIISNAPGMVFQCILRTGSGVFLFSHVSEGAVMLFGLSPAQIQENWNSVALRVLECDRDSFYESLHHSAQSMEVWNWEGRTNSSSGQEKWINCRATPRFSSNGDVIWEGLMLNITEGKLNEVALIQSGQLLRRLSAYAESVREEERKRVAREVHDELGQALTVLRMDLSMLRLNFGALSAHFLEQVQDITTGVDRTIKIMRHITSTLRPIALDLGLVAGLEWLVAEIIDHSGIECRLNLNGCDEVLLDDNRATALFRIVQESLSNVIKHANATKVDVSIDIEGQESIFVEIRDNGSGFLVDMTKTGSFGLIGMAERAMMLGGILNVTSTIGAGTSIEVCIPMTQE